MSGIEKQSKPIKGIKGGRRNGAGRKAGVPNKKTAAVQRAVAESGITPLDYMLTVMRSEIDPGADIKEHLAAVTLRFEAAKAAAPYVHPRLAAIEHSGNKEAPLVVQVLKFADDPASQ